MWCHYCSVEHTFHIFKLLFCLHFQKSHTLSLLWKHGSLHVDMVLEKELRALYHILQAALKGRDCTWHRVLDLKPIPFDTFSPMRPHQLQWGHTSANETTLSNPSNPYQSFTHWVLTINVWVHEGYSLNYHTYTNS